ncbi:MAG: hypothetical protein NT126_10055 [Bacteroidetes bacterium]|nr:hypothetical protein [Bacteroidota bacterium]
MKNIKFKSALVLFIGSVLLFSSCSKKDDAPYGSSSTTSKNEALDRRIKTLIHKIPNIVYKRAALRTGAGTLNTQSGFDFSDPNSGYNYSSPSGVTWSTSSNTMYLSASSLGSNPSGGTVVAGSSALDMNYTFCFTSTDPAGGVGLFNTGAPTNGVSGVIGVSGDFAALANANDSTSFSDIFHGLAFYFVYDGQASGSYDVIDWSNANWSDSTSIDQKCFAYVFDFVNGKLYFSLSGTLNVTGGSMDFNGQYLEISGFILDQNGLNTNNITYRTVPGFGAMGCN